MGEPDRTHDTQMVQWRVDTSSKGAMHESFGRKVEKDEVEEGADAKKKKKGKQYNEEKKKKENTKNPKRKADNTNKKPYNNKTKTSKKTTKK